MVATTLKAFALAAALATTVIADGPTGPPKGDYPGPPKGDYPGPPKGDYPGPPKGDYPGPPKGDYPGPPKGDYPGPPKGDAPKGDEVTNWGDWNKCKVISEEPYVCDDEYGHEYTTTYTLYPHDCTLYYDKPTPTPKKDWNDWNKCKVIKEEPYVCDDEYGHEVTSTYTLYPHDCTLYYEKPTPTPKKDWNHWPKEDEHYDPYHPHPYPPKPTDPAKWAEWEIEKKIVIITIIEEYKVPCSTGWADETTTIYTTHCGCKETPVPEHPPYVTYTTECPDEWGVGKTVTYTVPQPTWTPKPEDYSWLEWNKPEDKTPVYDAEKTPVYDAEKDKTTTWAEYTPVEPAKETTWNTWATSPAVVAKPTGWSPVASWEGAASSSSVSKIMIAAAGAAAGLALFL